MIPWPRKVSGNSPMVDTLNRLIERSKVNDAIDSSGVKYNKTLRGTAIAVLGGGGTVSRRVQIGQFIVKDIQDDWLNCLKYFSDTGQMPAVATETDWIKVAKPYELRFTNWQSETIDGITFSYAGEDYNWSRRKATRGSVNEIQIIVRPWYVGEIIYAVHGIGGGTNAFDADDNSIAWLDLNNAGRGWAKTPNSDPVDVTL